jgi:hypothetical protein
MQVEVVMFEAQGFQFPSIWKIKTPSCKSTPRFYSLHSKAAPPHKRCFCQLNEPCTIAHSTIQWENPFICCAWKAWSCRPPLIFWPMPLGYRLQPHSYDSQIGGCRRNPQKLVFKPAYPGDTLQNCDVPRRLGCRLCLLTLLPIWNKIRAGSYAAKMCFIASNGQN